MIRDDEQQVATTVADIVEGYVRRGPATLGLATGSSPLPSYRELARRHREHGLDFSACRAFLLDEYVGLPKTHPQSYFSVIRAEFTDQVNLDPERVSGPDGEAVDIAAEAQRYDAALAACGGVDVQLLGIGTDGHIAFNEPSSSLTSRTRVKTLTAQTRSDNARFFDGPGAVPRHVLTQGLGTIGEARHLVLIAVGERKADAVAAAVEGPLTAFCPASVIQLHRHATVVIDEAAAGGLRLADYYRYALAHKPAWQSF
ncbi:Glucosamine-6-phosphate deaminase (Glucosamine-6-phosphate isomerase) (GNPDA) (GlcN6P deaminase) [Nocardia cyriacigeorgica GUH-2]|uniref:Glucosamine-6-phosphate deaminase n=1 Tax=Nocardia cyriacigeorgica (strain GUH-2) TaxID=1127134 RepID=H6RD75_NOCCG|nr:Glucosamine-6-phosphate deaminase (Glucosamine-6-phosphate isomerase) (GNPDA) (GlcN6P deaminase) [Nocardia cyriacigeorgica GUH-2]